MSRMTGPGVEPGPRKAPKICKRERHAKHEREDTEAHVVDDRPQERQDLLWAEGLLDHVPVGLDTAPGDAPGYPEHEDGRNHRSREVDDAGRAATDRCWRP